MTITKKAPNIEMIHLFSSNFLFGWMMEHCREDKLSLEEPGPGLTARESKKTWDSAAAAFLGLRIQGEAI